MKKLSILLLILLGFILQGYIFGQTHDETKAEVPELKAFHEVIFKLWHDAWPNKDIALFKELVPGVDSHAVKVNKAQLPGILRDKKERWDEGVKSLNQIVAEYKKAIATTDTQKILDAAEKLHAQYEKLVRTIRPVLKEIDSFHQVLYPLYHYYMPEYNKEKIKVSVTELQAKMDELNKTELPERLAEKGKTFNTKRDELDKAVRYLVKVVKEVDDEETVTKAIKDMHTKYQAVEHIFD
ncbi:MAG: hypothetical protein HY800_01075 [Ignavibacteriales bacterium]|nr:hypothetical protein [Ignavibacteriales bacterium]